MSELTSGDIGVLIEALQAWENKHVSGDLMETMLKTMLPKEVTENPKHIAEEDQRRELAKQKKAERKEMSILLQAKLITLRSEMAGAGL